jgi:hypothetical protein
MNDDPPGGHYMLRDEGFDTHWGARTHRAVTHYMTLVKAYNEAKNTGRPPSDLQAMEAEIQTARDLIEEQQDGPRDFFEDIFHKLHLARPQAVKDTLRRYQRYLDELPTDFEDPSFVKHRVPRDKEKTVEPPLVQQRRFLENAIYEMKEDLARREAEEKPKPPPSPADLISAQIQQQIEIEARLRERCEEDVRKYPDQEETIRRSYRKAIDALRDR